MRTKTEQINVTLDFTTYPNRHTCEGEDLSPHISIKGLDAPYFALIIDDPDAKENPYTHWTAWNIRNTNEVPEGVAVDEHPGTLPGAVQGTNTGGTVGYSGPCPPHGSVHRYILKVYGLDAPLDLPPGADVFAVKKALQGRYRQYGEAIATYGR